MRNLKFGIVILIIFFSIIYFLSPSDEESRCFRYNEFLPLKFNGVIIAKYLDSSQHFYPTIVLHQIITNDTLRFYLIHEKSQLYEFLEKGDTISKKANLNILTIKRSGAVLSKKIDFGCKDTLR